MKIYSVGGSVRDKLLGLKPTDLDYVMVLDDTSLTIEKGFSIMKKYLQEEGFSIFLETEAMCTIRAKFPKGHKNEGITGDFVLARKEVGYVEGTRRPILEIGTLYDDLERRDFTLNALAEDEEGNIVDFFNGREALERGILETPLEAKTTLNDDPLRMLRALRFHITKGFSLSADVIFAMSCPSIRTKLRAVVSQERIREEILKMMKHDTIRTIKILAKFNLLDTCFGGEMWLKPTFEAK